MRLVMTMSAVAAIAVLSVSSVAFAQDKADIATVLKTSLGVAEGREITVKRYNVPPGWVTPKHYHTGHVTLYIEGGSATMKLEGKIHSGRAGDVLQALPKQVMVMSNTSNSERLRFVVFQVGDEGAPYIVKVK